MSLTESLIREGPGTLNSLSQTMQVQSRQTVVERDTGEDPMAMFNRGVDPQPDDREELIIHLRFDNGAVMDVSRIAVETAIDRLFREWLLSLLDSSAVDVDSALGRDIFAFRQAQAHPDAILNANLLLPPTYYTGRIEGLPGLVLLRVEGGSLRKRVLAGVMYVLSLLPKVGTDAAAIILAERIAPHIQTVTSHAPVSTKRILQEFVSHLGMIQAEIRAGRASRHTYSTLLPLYAKLAEIPNGDVTIAVALHDNVGLTFQLTSDEARRDLPRLVEMALANERR